MTRRHPGSTESYSEHTRTHTFSLTWQTDHYSPWRMAFKALLNAKVVLSNFLCAYSTKKNCQNGLLLKTQLRVLSIIDQLHVWALQRSAYAQLSPLYPSLYSYVTHVINYPMPSPTFSPYCKRWKAGWGLGTRLSYVYNGKVPFLISMIISVFIWLYHTQFIVWLVEQQCSKCKSSMIDCIVGKV